jgi:hypothetical protein
MFGRGEEERSKKWFLKLKLKYKYWYPVQEN